MAKEFMSELVCGGCGHTGHITWEGEGNEKRVVNMSNFLKQTSEEPPLFTCLNCGTEQTPV